MTFEVYIDLNGGLNFVKRWVIAMLDNRFSAFNGVGADLTKEM